MARTLIEFQDHGQDLLWWITDEAGKVIDCGPYQADLWCRMTVTNLAALKVGAAVEYGGHGSGSIKYPVAHVIQLAPIDIVVRRPSDAYMTATVKGKRASCTSSDREAVLNLGRKLFLGQFEDAERLPGQPGDHESGVYSRWRIMPKEVP
ncbi:MULTISPECIES: hypothetical protein [unclassified Pseudomonas]|uniref:hypothetical protein n=1 Tax=unclassified Pseudomonas TaxID=196821 RepID=UPI00244B283C|nr:MULTISPECIES: hypothetical protein [unclassified Pseudomonas]MDH0894393.1 hypothetical protein [Pseudomonas sp. GD03875]MDH1063312.1 hypothetical protein [Pseudomonas sp. GD03985]